MRTALFAAALLLGTAAVAQEVTDDAYTVPPSDSTTTDMQDVTSAPFTTPSAPPISSTGSLVQPDNSNPEHDARGIAVISDPAMVPPGFNGTGGAVGGPLEPIGPDESYPNCSRTITDNCLQAYERGRSPN
jgi:hypothetical protein